jgi:hypothetical protein
MGSSENSPLIAAPEGGVKRAASNRQPDVPTHLFRFPIPGDQPPRSITLAVRRIPDREGQHAAVDRIRCRETLPESVTELFRILDLQAAGENHHDDPAKSAASVSDLHARTKAFDAFQVMWRRLRFAAKQPHLQLPTPAPNMPDRLSVWSRILRVLFQRAEGGYPVQVMAKVFRIADRIAAKMGEKPVVRTPAENLADAVRELDVVIAWCDRFAKPPARPHRGYRSELRRAARGVRVGVGGRCAQVNAEVVDVFDGFQPFTLASRTAAGKWVVNGLNGLEFDSFVVMPPRDQGGARRGSRRRRVTRLRVRAVGPERFGPDISILTRYRTGNPSSRRSEATMFDRSYLGGLWCRSWHRICGFWASQTTRDREGRLWFATCSRCGRTFFEEQSSDHD